MSQVVAPASGLRPEGQDQALAVLRDLSLRGDAAPRTLLLAGPEGVGRRVAARWYAALLNCEARLDEPCGRCAACRGFLPDEADPTPSSDYREVAPALTTRDGKATRRPQLRLDQLVARERAEESEPLGPWLALRPVGRWRVGVIDRAETMTEEAANAFLKTLEEPPARSIVILIAPGPDALLPTVASRCTVVRFRPAEASEDVVNALAPHPAIRLGRPGMWRSAMAQGQATEAKREAVEAFLRSLDGSLQQAFEAAEALAELWTAGDDEVGLWLREAWRAEGPSAYALGDQATTELESAWAAYAHHDLALRAWVMRLRQGL